MDEFKKICKRKNIRITTPRKQLFTVLFNAERPLFLSEINKSCQSIDRSSIYRTLELFRSKGIIDSVPMGFKKRYELASPFRPHHHHFICNQCHTIIEIKSPTLEKLITHISDKHHITITGHIFELHGLCEQCQKNQTN